MKQVEPFLDITSIYHHLTNPKAGKKIPKETKSLATICEEMLKISLSKVRLPSFTSSSV